MQLTFKVNLMFMNGHLLIDFRLSKGDGLEFKKLFLKIKNLMRDVTIKNSIQWPVKDKSWTWTIILMNVYLFFSSIASFLHLINLRFLFVLHIST